MRRLGIGMLMVLLYCFPFVYFSMYQDFMNRAMFGYVSLILAPALIAFLSYYFNHFIPIVVGNIVSLIISYFLIRAGSERWEGWDYYFKPLAPSQFLFFVSILNLIPQLIATKLAKVYKKKAEHQV
ncbi:hypothetical protein [Pullulanibacillus pueri]|uniref:Uncharacterized protein n=1 Tax=Pullulanibacillus pueri TaxID=1437324 RepID=A0A8J3A0A3_9BACL|nr:hypothetical protein [Pullulanibacillus pueri]GGH87275.1 hypothetical protein GCM10007096_36920 [Pullulanibacillus pueri]